MSAIGTIRVELPKNRDLSGRLKLFDMKRKLIASMEVLGRGNKGPGDTSMLKEGNTPTGSYDGSEMVDTVGWDTAKYGDYGAIRLRPIGGNALFAHDVMGRRGLLIHGGDLGGAKDFRGVGELRATQGCLRVRNSDMRLLLHELKNLRIDPYNKVCWTGVTVTVHVLEN